MVRGLQPGDPPTIGPYRLVGQLGGGGMGRVFLGVSAGGRPVAVKVIRAELATDPQFRTRFGREVAAARQVSGVFTAPVVDADVDGPVPWLATAYVPGPSLAEAVDEHGPLPPGSLLTLAAGLAESLSAIHAAGVVHRDLKPSNVLLAQDGPRVIDFGISRAAESSALTQTGLVIGSPGFMSPEQAMGQDAGPPSDMFSLGAVLAYAATGEGPFGTGTTVALLYRVVHGSPSLDRVPAGVRPLIERCLTKDPAARPTAGALLAQVGALQPAADWLPESIIRAFGQDAATIGAGAAAVPTTTADAANSPRQAASGEGLLLSAAGDGHRPPPPGGGKRRRRSWRPLALAWIIGFLIAAGTAAFAVTAMTAHTPAPLPSPAAQVSSSTAARPAEPTSAAPPVSPSASASPVTSTSPPPSASASPSPSASPSASPSPSSAPPTSPAAKASTSPAASASTSPSSATATSTSPSASASSSP